MAIDQGTTGTTMLLVDKNGAAVHKYTRSFAQIYPKPGWVEHDPELIWETVLDGLKEILGLPWLDPKDLKAIGITNQRETVVMWERATGKPVHPAIVWQCRRTSDRCIELAQSGIGPEIEKKTGLRLDPYFSATKIAWMFETIPGLREKAVRGDLACGTVDAWLIWKLTGGRVHCTDPSNASRTLLYNIHQLKWDPELLNLFDIPASLLPEVKPSSSLFGETDPVLTSRPIPITGVLGDQQAALFGQGCLEPGMIKNTYGTGCFLLMNTGEKPCKPERGLLTSVAWQIGGKVDYVLEGSVFNGGAVVQWLRDELGIIQTAAESEAIAMGVADTNGVYLVPAFTGLGTPHWDPYARGIIGGLTRGAKRAHIVRAALEGIAYQVREIVDSMCALSPTRPEVLRVDGGAAANNFLLQFQADICGLRIQRNSSVELTGIGAAFMAGLTAGLWRNPEELTRLVSLERTFEPHIGGPERDKLFEGWLRAIERSKNWVW